jgi:hypothetical protein
MPSCLWQWSYYDGEKFEDNYWSSDDEEGANQILYHDKKSPNGYRYAGSGMVKDHIEVPDGFTRILLKGIMPQYDWMNDYGIKIYVSFEKCFKTKCDLDSGTWDPSAQNGQNDHKHPHHALPTPEEEERTNLTTP